jgi:hypothetical protein
MLKVKKFPVKLYFDPMRCQALSVDIAAKPESTCRVHKIFTNISE